MESEKGCGFADSIRSFLKVIGLKCPQCRSTDVLFFPDSKLPCGTFYNKILEVGDTRCRKKECKHFHNPPRKSGEKSELIKLYKILNTVRRKLDLCIYLLTEENLFNFIRHLHKNRDIKIRFLTDADVSNDKKINNKAYKLQEEGIEVRTNAQDPNSSHRNLMHNKFVLVDDRKLITGSFNWTLGAILNNDESLIIINQKRPVQKFVNKFNELWAKAKPLEQLKTVTTISKS